MSRRQSSKPAPDVEPPKTAAASPYSTEVVEPDWFADGDFAWLDAAEHAEPEPPTQEPVAVADVEAAGAAELAEAEAEVVAEELAVAELESAPGAYPEAMAVAEPVELTPPVLILSEEELARLAVAEPVEPTPPVLTLSEDEQAEAELESARGDYLELVAVAEPEEPTPPLLTLSEDEAQAEVEDLAEAELEAAEQAEVEEMAEAEAEVVVEEPAAAELEPAPGGYPEPIAATEPEELTPPVLILSEEELARLAADEGWGASEVEAIRSLIGSQATPAPIELPGSAELDAAMAALEATPREEQWWKPSPAAEPTYSEGEQVEQVSQVEPISQVEPGEPLAPVSQVEPVEPLEPISRVEPVWPPAALVPQPPATPAQRATSNEPVRPPAALVPQRPAAIPLPATSNEPAWLRRRRGPAATAFRTLRRLFPG